jgi:hypothetical protein
VGGVRAGGQSRVFEYLFVFEKTEAGANDLTGVAQLSIADICVNKLFEVRRKVDVLGRHELKLPRLTTIVNFKQQPTKRKAFSRGLFFQIGADQPKPQREKPSGDLAAAER